MNCIDKKRGRILGFALAAHLLGLEFAAAEVSLQVREGFLICTVVAGTNANDSADRAVPLALGSTSHQQAVADSNVNASANAQGTVILAFDRSTPGTLTTTIDLDLDSSVTNVAQASAVTKMQLEFDVIVTTQAARYVGTDIFFHPDEDGEVAELQQCTTITPIGAPCPNAFGGSNERVVPGTYRVFIELSATADDLPSGPILHSRLHRRITSIWLDADSTSDEFRWQTAPQGDFDAEDNWNPTGVPNHDAEQSDTAIFDEFLDDNGVLAAGYSVNAANAKAGRFLVDSVELDLNGTAEVFGTSIANPSLTIRRGGRLRLDNGARLAAVNASVGFSPNFPGALAGLEIGGVGSDCSLSGRLIVGEFSDADLTIDGGATLSCAQAIVGDIAPGQVAITGAGSRWDADALTIGAVSADGRIDVREAAELVVFDRLVVGDLSTGTISLSDGGKLNVKDVVIGNSAGGIGIITLPGDSSEDVRTPAFESTGIVTVGVAGNGTLEVLDGATAHLRELKFGDGPGQAQVTIKGTDFEQLPSDLTVLTSARLGRGVLDVFEGATANFLNLTLGGGGESDVGVGRDPTSTIEHVSTLNASQLTVGFDHPAALTVTPFGQVNCTELRVNSLETGGVGRIAVQGGAIVVSGAMKISGDNDPFEIVTGAGLATENVVIENDGQIQTSELRLGDEAAEFADAEIVIRNGISAGPLDNGSFLLVQNGDAARKCAIGGRGDAIVRLERFGSFSALGTASVGNSPDGGTGTVEVGSDCGFNTVGNLDIGGASAGTVRLLANTSVINVFSAASAQVNADGTIEGIGFVNGALFVNPGGVVAPGVQFGSPPPKRRGLLKNIAHQAKGNSVGELTINGDFEQREGGTLRIEIAGLEPGQFDVLFVNGAATLAGRLEVRFLNGFLPKQGDSFDFVQTVGDRIGSFGEVVFPDIAPGFDVVLLGTDDGKLRLTALNDAEPGDGATIDPSDENPLSVPAACGGAACGAGVVPMLPLTFAMLAAARIRCGSRRRVSSNRAE